MKKKYADGGRARSAPSYEEDMTPPPGMRNFRSRTLPGGEEPAGRRRAPVEIPSYEEDITPPRGMMRPSREPMPLPPIPPPMPPRRMAKGGMAKKNWGSTEDIVGHGKTSLEAHADYERKMKAAGLKPKGMAAGGSVSRGDGCAARGKTRGRMI